MADHNNAKDAVTAWLNESEGFSLRIERLHEDAASGNDLVPWLVEAFLLGADRAAPERQGRALREAANSFDRIRSILINNLNEPERSAFWEAVGAFKRVRAALVEYEAALTSPPAAPTGNTALVEAALGMKRIVEEIDGVMKHGTWRDERGKRLKDTPEWVAFYNALANQEAPPAAQEPSGRVKVPAGQTPLDDKLGHRLLDVLNEGSKARDDGTGIPYHGHSLEHCLHAAGWVMRDLRLALDAAKADLAAARAEIEQLTKERDNLSKLEQSHREQANEQFHRANKAGAERDEARASLRHMEGFDRCTCGPCAIHGVTTLADAERDMRQRAAKVCDRNDQVSGWVSRDAILALPLKYADREAHDAITRPA